MDSRYTPTAWGNGPGLHFMIDDITGIRHHNNTVAYDSSLHDLTETRQVARSGLTVNRPPPDYDNLSVSSDASFNNDYTGAKKSFSPGGSFAPKIAPPISNVGTAASSLISLANPISFAASAGINVLGGVISAGIGAAATVSAAHVTADAENRKTDLDRELADRSWDAARSAGLLSPAQFEEGNSDYYEFRGRTASRVMRADAFSPYA